jgi:hypothetical protein
LLFMNTLLSAEKFFMCMINLIKFKAFDFMKGVFYSKHKRFCHSSKIFSVPTSIFFD